MRLVWHLARTDASRWWWLFGCWCLLVLLSAWLADQGPLLQLRDDVVGASAAALSDWLPTLRRVCFVVLAAFVVLETPLVSSTAFWLTRPIDRTHLLLAKLLTLTTALVIWPTVVDLVVMAQRHLSADVVVLAAADNFIMRFLALLVVVLAAALASSPVRLLLFGLAAFVGGAALLVGLAMIMVERLVAIDLLQGPPNPPISSTAGPMVILLLLIGLSGGLLIHQFLTRRRVRTIAAGFAGLLAIVAVVRSTSLPQWLRAEEPPPPAWALDASSAALQVESPAGVVKEDAWQQRSLTARRHVAGNIVLTGVPQDCFAEVFAAESQFVLPDGTELRGAGGSAVPVAREEEVLRPIKNFAWQEAVGQLLDATRSPQDPRRYEEWPILATIDASRAQQLLQSPARYRGTFEIHLWRYRVADQLPLQDAAVFNDGRQLIEIRRVARNDGALDLLVRRTIASPALLPELEPSYNVVVRHRARREVLNGYPRPFPGAASVSLVRAPWHTYSGGITSEGFGFSERHDRLRFGSFIVTNRIEDSWFDAAEVVVVETRYIGRIFRQLSVDSFQLTTEPDPTTEHTDAR